MKKTDLKTGMIVQERSGDVGLVVNGTIIWKSGSFSTIYEYRLDLMYSDVSSMDIIKVSCVQHGINLVLSGWVNVIENERKILWKRDKSETVKIGDYEYDKKEFEEATKHLKPVNK
jgi:hypothetical protein